ncbi:MAG TPA: hypothetical protein VGR70_07515 [Stellaceae bacterium]|nr:hypothetical protein [Stellaceae bacterium]
MRILFLAGVLIAVPIAAAEATDDPQLTRLATCQDSWVEWKSGDPTRLNQLVSRIQAEFTEAKFGAYTPKSSLAVLGFPVAQVYPESVGMGVGFSVVVNATFDAVKAALGKTLGKPLKCEKPSDNMRTCGLEIADKKTIMLMAEDNPKATTTLFGCYYFYEK